MAVVFNNGEQIIALSPADTVTKERMAVESIILRGTAAGVFSILLGNTAMSIDTSANAFTIQLSINRGMNSISLVSGPAGAVMYVLLEQKR